MNNEQKKEILLKLALNKEEWSRIGNSPLKKDELLDLIKDGLIEVNGKDMKITDFGRKYLKEIEKT
jgi:coproporphyrinogen III oxidase-like Fe-S oxidoreductase